jgi:hypothetical protein
MLGLMQQLLWPYADLANIIQPVYPLEIVFECGIRCSRICGKKKLFEEISEHGIFHGISVWQENKLLNIKDKKGLFTMEWE